MNVIPGSILYPVLVLWRYLVSKSLIPIFGLNYRWGFDQNSQEDVDRTIPNELCSFINRLFLYFFVQVPVMFAVGTVIGILFILAPSMSIISLYMFGLETTLNDGDGAGLIVASGEVIFIIFTLGYFINKYSKNTRCKVIEKALSPLKSFYEVIEMYYKAKHDKFCPLLEFEEKKVVVKKAKNTK